METGKKDFLSRINFNSVFKKLLIFMPIGILGMFIFSYFTIKKDIVNLLQDFSYFYLLLALLLSFVPWITHTFRMAIWNHFLELKIPVYELFKISLGTELGAAITPSAVGGGPVKIGMLLQQRVSGATSLFLTVLGSAEDWFFFIIIVPFSFLMLKNEHLPNLGDLLAKFFHSSIFSGAVITIILLLCVTLIMPTFWQILINFFKRFPFFRKVFSVFTKLILDMKFVFQIVAQKGKRYFALSVLFTSIQWISRYSIIYLLLCGLGYRHNPFELFLLQVVVYLMMTFIPTPGSAIGAEASFYYIFQSIIPNDLIGFLTTAWRLLTYYLPILVAALLFLISNYRMVLKAKKTALPHFDSTTLKSKVQLT